MYTGNIKFIISIYKKHFTEIAPLERFKWLDIRIFQDNWDIEDDDFAGMMQRALPGSKIHKVLDNGAFYSPLANMKKMAQLDPNRVRTLFRNLLTDDYDFETDRGRFRAKLAEFERAADDLYLELNLPGRISHNDDQAALFYLTCKYPDRFCLFKPADFDKFYPLSGLNFLTRNSGKFEKLSMYLILWNFIRYEIGQDPELQKMVRDFAIEDEYDDPNFTVLAQDILHSLSYDAVMADVEVPLQNAALTNLLQPATGDLPALSFLPSSRSSRFDPANYVPIKLVCDIEQDSLDHLGLGKIATPYSIFHSPDRGFDVLSYDREGQEKYVLVKVTKAENPQTIEMSTDEVERISISPNRCWLYLIYQYDADTTSGFYLVQAL